MNFYNIIISIVVFTFTSCSSSRGLVNNKKDAFLILECTSQKWFGGIPGSFGEKYEIRLVANKSFIPDSLWIYGKACDVMAFKNNMVTNFIEPNDTIILRGNTRNTNKGANNPNADTLAIVKIIPPIKFDGQALVSYIIGNEKFYYAIDSVIVKKSIYYP